jgi:hypothetical protein
MFLMSLFVISTNFDSIITWSVGRSSSSMTGRMRFILEGRSVITRLFVRASTTILPPADASTSDVSVGWMSAALA